MNRDAGITQLEIDQRIFEWYDEYCHGGMDRREFFKRAAGLGAAGLAMAQAMLPNYARAETVAPKDPRIKAEWVEYPSPGGNSEKVKAYLAHPAGAGRYPAVLVMHENRGVNPYIADVARRAAVAGFVALAPEGMTALGGYPGNDDDGRAMFAKLDQPKMRTDMLNGAKWLKAHKLSTGKLGATGFCWGGGTANYLATALGADLQAAAPYYGVAAATSDVPKIKAALQVHLAENDERVNSTYPAYEQALKAAGARYEIHVYPGTQHGFHNDSTPRFVEAAAKTAWDRTVAFFKKNLA
jgi:carboxymethylenebutenolidase